MKLLIDVGNTAIKFVKCEKDQLTFVGRFYTKDSSIEKMDEVLSSLNSIEQVVVSSVVPAVNKALNKYFKSKYNLEPTYIKVGDYPDVRVDIEDPSELGIDLYCDIVYGYKVAKEKHQPTLVIDLGTASKIMLVDENGLFNSCVILPGIEISKKILSSSTAQLPFFEVLNVKKITESRNTVEVINSSIYYGHIESINGLIGRIENEIGKKCNYIITGGNAPGIEKELKGPHEYDPLVCFKGMYQIIFRG